MEVQIPVGIVEADNVNSLKDLENYAINLVEKTISQSQITPAFIAKVKQGLAVVDLSVIAKEAKENWKKPAKFFLKQFVEQVEASMGVMIMESWALSIPLTDIEKYKSGELNPRENPEKKPVVSVIIQRPGHFQFNIYSVDESGETRRLGSKMNSDTSKTETFWFIYEDHVVQ